MKIINILRSIVVGFGALAFLFTIGAIANNYTVSQGTGTTFGSVVIGGVNFASQLLCDMTTANQCAGVNASGSLSVNATVSGNPNVTVSNTPAITCAGCSTAANQSTEITGINAISANTGGPIPPGTALIGYTSPDPCSQGIKSQVNISQNTNTQLITGTSAKKSYICSILAIVDSSVGTGAANVALVEGVGTACANATGALIGGTTSGMSLSANSGFSFAGGLGTVIPVLSANADNVCLYTNQLIHGTLTFVQQ
jgi:hypothetical protein